MQFKNVWIILAVTPGVSLSVFLRVALHLLTTSIATTILLCVVEDAFVVCSSFFVELKVSRTSIEF